jgi:hypothetical protein
MRAGKYGSAKASFALAATRRGALIAPKGRSRLGQLLTGWISRGGQISREMLEAVSGGTPLVSVFPA